ncbi:exonuclease domain-containing protein [Deinococcus metallilatus]|uniref:Exonuclease domain-containing protein n=1 Tax=Deinococcus metallilatus TaxID=1211322 RepID=A0AAJ5K0E6_9DEIO|nr:3'-5' exonuclease [Deinococcus metallilatus]MBB5294925.1 inhibitor of KinA sporulation pathway (predicted exonuclease) [Deinococcus metallilatus]QBY09368.1 exonuclease domain-containing protein [Deinococcus metallilatus]RXJ09373.1 exonuclease domain-containing protein [Deinococcus metallilatus]TLK28895.1 exonuclease domain-containing protein [Deinococcus metallilatus]GMA16854.1 DNA polymerase III [Deinococcus metallilatus]
MTLLNVVDVEATCWAGEPPPGQRSEIIEIGLCVLDLVSLERLEKCSLLVRPEHSEVSAFCTQLTGLTPEKVAAGIPFREACEILRREFSSESRPWASWGDYDRKQFERQYGGEVRYPFGSRHVNAKQVYASGYGLRRRGMARALQRKACMLEGIHHCGADDAWNIAALIARMVRDGVWSREDRGQAASSIL